MADDFQQIMADQVAAGEDPPPATEEEAPDTSQEAPDSFYAGTYRDRESVEQGLAEKDRLIYERAEEVGELRRQLQEAQQAQQYYQQPQQAAPVEDGPHKLTQAELLQVNQSIQSLKMEGRTDEALELQLNLNEVMHQRDLYEQEQKFEQRLAQLEGPFRKFTGDTAAKGAIDSAKAYLGPNADQLLNDNREFVVEFVESFPTLLEKNGTLSPKASEFLAAQVLGADALRRQRGGTPARNDQGQFVPVSGGSGAEPAAETTPQTEQLEPGDPRLAFQQQVKKDAFGVIPSFAGE